MLYRLAILFWVLILIAACGSPDPVADLMRNRWQLIEINGQPPLTGQQSMTIIFTTSDRLSGFSGCNTYGGSYRLDGATIAISDLITTFIACSDPIGAQEIAFHQALQAATHYEVNAGVLSLVDDQGAVVLRFQAV